MKEEWALEIRKKFVWHSFFSLDEFNTFVEMITISSWLFICKRTVLALLPFGISVLISLDSFCHQKYDSVHSRFQRQLEILLQDLKKVKVP